MNQQKFIQAIAGLSFFAFTLAILALVTEHWLEATAILTERLQSNVSYGLFSGSLERHQLASTLKFTLTITCNLEADACMFSCQKDAEHREAELIRVLKGEDLDPCENMRSSKYIVQNKPPALYKANNVANGRNQTSSAEEFISSPLYICTVVFLILALSLSLTSLICAIINLKWFPIERIFNIFGLFIWNGMAACIYLFPLIFWCVLFGKQLIYNIAITDTLRKELNFSSHGNANLGYSFYMLLPIIFIHILNILLLFWRQKCIEKEPHNVPNNIQINDTEARLEYY